MPRLLEPAELTDALTSLNGWHGDTASISRTVTVGGDAAISAMLQAMEVIARELDHDPDTAVAGNDLTITMSTHSAGGVTELDVEYARRVDAIISD